MLEEKSSILNRATKIRQPVSGIRISVVIITYNEERNIGRCLDSVQEIADEVVVLDSFSSDGTEAICGSRGVRFFQHVFDGYGQQKNRALALATHDFVLSLDADEALGDALRQSVLAVKQRWTCDAYTMNRLNRYCGQWIRHGGWYPDRKLRLFDRRCGRWAEADVHERIEMDPQALAGHLPGDLLHYSYYSVAEHRDRSRKYAASAARFQWKNGRRSSPARLFLGPAFTFFRIFFLKAGFLDGRGGWNIARVSAQETYWRYRELRRIECQGV